MGVVTGIYRVLFDKGEYLKVKFRTYSLAVMPSFLTVNRYGAWKAIATPRDSGARWDAAKPDAAGPSLSVVGAGGGAA